MPRLFHLKIIFEVYTIVLATIFEGVDTFWISYKSINLFFLFLLFEVPSLWRFRFDSLMFDIFFGKENHFSDSQWFPLNSFGIIMCLSLLLLNVLGDFFKIVLRVRRNLEGLWLDSAGNLKGPIYGSHPSGFFPIVGDSLELQCD